MPIEFIGKLIKSVSMNCDTRQVETIQANSRLNYLDLTKILISQAWWEINLRFSRHINFRKRENASACQAYSEMSPREFEWINARQQWANWRTIPKNLTGLLADQPIMAIDLCCGVGHSTEVLAYYLPLGSKVLGLEYNPAFVKEANTKRFTHRSGRTAEVTFNAQSVLEVFCNKQGEKIEDNSVDLVNSSGAVGCHFDFAATSTLVKEVSRVLKRGGLAMIDSGKAGTRKEELISIFEANGFMTHHSAKSCYFDLYTQVCFLKK